MVIYIYIYIYIYIHIGLHEEYPFSCHNLMKLELSPQIVENYSSINFHENSSRIERKMCVMIPSTHFPETFLVLKRNERGMVINIYRSSWKVPVFLSYFNETWTVSTDCRKLLKYQLSWKSVQGKPSCSMLTDGQKKRHNEANSRFSQHWERA